MQTKVRVFSTDKSLKLSPEGNLCSWRGGRTPLYIYVLLLGNQDRELFFCRFQLPSAQNNLYAKVAYFGVAYSATLHNQQDIAKMMVCDLVIYLLPCSSSNYSIWGKPAPGHKGPTESPMERSMYREVRPPARSQHQLASHVCQPSWMLLFFQMIANSGDTQTTTSRDSKPLAKLPWNSRPLETVYCFFKVLNLG